METFGKRLSMARRRIVPRLTQKGLADLMELHGFTVAKWEQGLHEPQRPGDYEKLAKILNCNKDWLERGDGEMEVHRPTAKARRQSHQSPLCTPEDLKSINWHLLAQCACLLLDKRPNLRTEPLAKGLQLFYYLACRSPDVVDGNTAADILQAIES